MKKKWIVTLIFIFVFITIGMFVLSWFHHCEECHVKDCPICHFVLSADSGTKRLPSVAVKLLTQPALFILLFIIGRKFVGDRKATPISLKVKMTD